MRITMMGYEVEIKAKDQYIEKRFNEADTKALLNIIASHLFEIGRNYSESEDKVYRDCAPIRYEQGREIFDQLDKLGYYDNIRK